MKWFHGASAVTLAVLAVATSAAADAQAARTVAFAIPAGDLSRALSAFSSATGMQVIASPALVDGRRTQGVTGRHSARDGLALLLRGTGLRPATSNGVMVLRADRPAARTATASAAPAIPVAAAALPLAEQADASDDIVVTGFRGSLLAAQDLKRRAVGTEDNILASDIAAFPDLNLAEALQRVAGVTINRDTGEGRQITLRGLGPDFTRTQLNGMEVLGNTASGMDNRGNVSRTRGFDFSLFASELFNRVSVQKSYAADQDEGGIAGTVQLFTAKPFDYDGPRIVLSAKGQTNDQTSGVTPRIVGLFSQRQGDFGALVSVAYSKIRNNEYGYRNWGWGKVKYKDANFGPEIDAATRDLLRGQLVKGQLVGTIYAPQAQSPSTWYTDRERMGVTAALQYHPGDRFKLDVDLLYGRLADHRDDWAVAAGGYNPLTGDVSGTQVIHSATIEGNSLVAATYTGIDQRTEHHTVENETNFYQAVANASWGVSDRLKVTALAGYQKSDFAQPVFDKVFLQARNTGFGFDDRPTIPVNSYGVDLTDPSVWNVQRLVTQENTIKSDYTNAQVQAIYDLTPILKLEAGGEYKRFTNSGYQYLTNIFYGTAATSDRAVPDSLKYVINRDSLIPYVGGDVDAIYALLGNNRTLTAANLTAGSDFSIREKTWAGFAQLDLDTYLGTMHLRGNAGVRYYHTGLVSTGSLAVVKAGVTSLEPRTVKTSSDDWLPTLNVALDITPRLIARASASRNVTRPGLPQLAAAGTLTTAPFGGTVSVGNPYLQPSHSTSVEGGLEYYMDRNGFASAGFFWKDLDSFIVPDTSQVTYSQTGFPLSLLLPGQDGTTPYNYVRSINGTGASIKGVEVALQHDFTFLPAPFDHFGAVANGTWIDGHQDGKINDVIVRTPIYNLSKWAANATLYFETERFGARVSTAFRSRYLTGLGGNGNLGEGIRPTNNIDFQIRYNLTPEVRLIAEGVNVTNTPIEQFTDLTADRTLVYTTSGRIFTFGVTASF